MAAYSGLWDGVHSEPYPSQTLAPHPPISGVLRVLLQKRGLYGFVRGFGRNAPASITQAQTARETMSARGGYDYSTRQQDAGNMVEIANMGDGTVNVPENNVAPAVPADADATDMLRVADTVRNRDYVADTAAHGATAPELPEVRET